MKRVILISISIVISTYAFGCTCSQSINSYFLKQVKNFDAVVEGAFYQDRIFIVDKVYKGNISRDTIEIVQAGNCSEAFMKDPDRTLILGLYKSKYKSNLDAFSAPSCVTSVLVINEDKVEAETQFYNLQVRRPRVGMCRNEIRKDRFVKKIKRRL